MIALTLHQPWAYAILHLGKDVENRMWWQPAIVGELAIHAGKTYDFDGYRFIRRLGLSIPAPAELPTGAVVGLVNVTGAHKECPQGRFCSPWAMGGYHWQLTDPRPLTPVPCRGMQKIWAVPDRVARAVCEQLADAGRVPETGGGHG